MGLGLEPEVRGVDVLYTDDGDETAGLLYMLRSIAALGLNGLCVAVDGATGDLGGVRHCCLFSAIMASMRPMEEA